tara:strand:+ start:755 stop:1222 length:468 start_codon:yes stop_codon:yes gene_type:complete
MHKKNLDNEKRFVLAAKALADSRMRNLPTNLGGSNCPILVEGKRDRELLKRLNFIGPIELVNRGWSLDRLVTHLTEIWGKKNKIDGRGSLILLMDWDRTGGRLQRTLLTQFEALDVKVDQSCRAVLLKCLKPETRTVEGINSLTNILLELMNQFN